MNPVLILTRNNLELTKRCVDSVLRQDIPVRIVIGDNASTDGTKEWIEKTSMDLPSVEKGGSVEAYFQHRNVGVSQGWNNGLMMIFNSAGYKHCLVIGNDTVLAPWTYSALLSANVPFVTGVDVGMSQLPDKPDVFPLSPHPDFSCFLIRRECWQKIGPFDERMVNYCGDTDYHVRAHRLGIPLWKASVPYNHERSSTMNRAAPDEKAKIQRQASQDREAFKSIYGCLPGTAAYNALFEVPVGEAKA